MSSRWPKLCSPLAAFVALIGCGDKTITIDVPEEKTPTKTCADLVVPGKQLRLDPVGRSQLQATAAFDGAVWVVYAQADADESGGFDIWATRLGCEGSVLTPPFRVNTATETNDLDPSIAVGDGHVAIAWMTDSGQFPNNLTIRYRIYRSDGTAVMSDERVLQTTRNGSPVTANMWQHAVAAVPQGFAIAGTRAPVETGGWQVFVQRLSLAGEPVGETIDGHLESGVSHQNAALTAGPGGALFAGWGRSRELDDLSPMHAVIQPGASTMLPDPPVEATAGRTGNYPTMASDAAGHVFLAFNSDASTTTNILVKDAAKFDPESSVLELAASRANSFAPRVAGAESGGAVAWFVQPQNGRSLAVRRFLYNGESFSRGELVSITAGAGQVAPQAPGLVHLTGKHYFVTWAEGTSPDYVLQGRFLALEDAP